MPPKNKFTREQILNEAFNIANSNGFESLTIRKLADALGSSIAPIYVNFKNIDELKYALAEKIESFATDIMLSVKTHDSFLDIGAGNIKLAMNYTQLYRDYHMNINCQKYFKQNHFHHSKLIDKMASSPKLKGLSENQMSDVLRVMSYVTYGMIFEYLLGKDTKSYDETVAYMEDVANDVIAGYKIRKGENQ